MFTITQNELSVQPMFTVFSFSPSYFQIVFFSKTVYQLQFHKCNQHAAYALGIITNPCQNMVDVNQAMALELNFPEKTVFKCDCYFFFCCWYIFLELSHHRSLCIYLLFSPLRAAPLLPLCIALRENSQTAHSKIYRI